MKRGFPLSASSAAAFVCEHADAAVFILFTARNFQNTKISVESAADAVDPFWAQSKRWNGKERWAQVQRWARLWKYEPAEVLPYIRASCLKAADTWTETQPSAAPTGGMLLTPSQLGTIEMVFLNACLQHYKEGWVWLKMIKHNLVCMFVSLGAEIFLFHNTEMILIGSATTECFQKKFLLFWLKKRSFFIRPTRGHFSVAALQTEIMKYR